MAAALSLDLILNVKGGNTDSVILLDAQAGGTAFSLV